MDTRETRLFRALDTEGNQQLTPQHLLSVLEDSGLTRQDPRLGDLYSRLGALEADGKTIDLDEFVDLLLSLIHI